MSDDPKELTKKIILNAIKSEKRPERLWYLDYFEKDPFESRYDESVSSFFFNQEKAKNELAEYIGFALKGAVGNIAIAGSYGCGKTTLFFYMKFIIDELVQTNDEFQKVKFVSYWDTDEENIHDYEDNNIVFLDDCTVFDDVMKHLRALKKSTRLIVSFWDQLVLERALENKNNLAFFDKILFLKKIENLDELKNFLELRFKYARATKKLLEIINEKNLSLILTYSKGIPAAILQIVQFIFSMKFKLGIKEIDENFVRDCLLKLGYFKETTKALRNTMKLICFYYLQYENYIKSKDLQEITRKDISTINKHIKALENLNLIERINYDGRGTAFRPKLAVFVQIQDLVDDISQRLQEIKNQT